MFSALGAFTKSAQFPFHIWLPGRNEAPTPVSAYLHSATIKAGFFSSMYNTYLHGMVLAEAGLLTLFWGSFNAVRQFDLKALLVPIRRLG